MVKIDEDDDDDDDPADLGHPAAPAAAFLSRWWTAVALPVSYGAS